MYFDTGNRDFIKSLNGLKNLTLVLNLLDDQTAHAGYDYSAYYQDPSAYSQQGYDASAYGQQSYGSGYGGSSGGGDDKSQGYSNRYGSGGGGYRDRESGRDNDRYGDSRGSYSSRRDNYQDQGSRNEPSTQKISHFDLVFLLLLY